MAQPYTNPTPFIQLFREDASLLFLNMAQHGRGGKDTPEGDAGEKMRKRGS